ncbi:MAG: hypothetical protein K8L99_23345 [Anaerolineae bacterium]|nr:hypothetical protein [Anaerolineae bacterium]
MPIHTFWDNEDKTVVRVENEGKWTWDEFHLSLDEVASLIESVDHRVDVINVDRPGASMPPGPPVIHFQRATRMFAQYGSLNIVVVRSALNRSMLMTFARMLVGTTSSTLMILDSEDEAYAMIEADRASA